MDRRSELLSLQRHEQELTEHEAVTALDEIAAQQSEPIEAHDAADDVLLAVVPVSVRAAYKRVVSATDEWPS